MGLVKCPRCELNYIQEGEKCCNVCRRGMKDDSDSDELNNICPECGEHTVAKGKELCSFCIREHIRRQKLENLAVAAEDGTPIAPEDVDPLEDMEEIDVPEDSDIPESEYAEIHRELGMDDEEEENEDSEENRTDKDE